MSEINVRQKLRDIIERIAAEGNNVLPSENTLAEELGISRTQLRDCMSELEAAGYISRRQGIGTRINQHVLNVPLRMDFEVEFDQRVRAMGFEPTTMVLETSIVTADRNLSEKLQVEEGTPLQKIAKLVKASGQNAIYCIDYISFKTIKDYNYTQEEFDRPIFEFLKKHCGTDVDQDLSEVNAAVADEKLSEILCVPVGSPLLNMRELGYDKDGAPILWSEEYYVPGIIRYTVLRKRIKTGGEYYEQ